MTIQERILQYLAQHPEGLDDAALTFALNLKQRQQANLRCRRLEQFGKVIRRRIDGRIRNFLNPDAAVADDSKPPQSVADGAEKPWFWEGRVQSAVVDFLRQTGYQIKTVAHTASKQQGKDIIAIAPSGTTLWISAKGYPVGTIRTNPPTQARHWFAQALFDLILWRGEDSSVSLALALPQKETHRKLASRAGWFLATTRNCIYWVDRNGSVTVENCSSSIGN